MRRDDDSVSEHDAYDSGYSGKQSDMVRGVQRNKLAGKDGVGRSVGHEKDSLGKIERENDRLIREMESSETLDLGGCLPEKVIKGLLEVKDKFETLRDDHLATEFELREFILKQRAQPMLYLNFLDKFDEKDRQTLNVILYKNLEKSLHTNCSAEDFPEEIDIGLIEQVKSEMLNTQEELLRLTQEVDHHKHTNSLLHEELTELKLILANLLRSDFNISEWIELVVITFTGLFRMLPSLQTKAENLYPGLNDQVKSLVMLSERLDKLSTTCKENFEVYRPFLSELQAENTAIETAMNKLSHSSDFWEHSRYFLLNLGEFLGDHVEKEKNDIISSTPLNLQ